MERSEDYRHLHKDKVREVKDLVMARPHYLKRGDTKVLLQHTTIKDMSLVCTEMLK